MGKKNQSSNRNSERRLTSPAKPKASQFRVNAATFICLGAAVALLVIDAHSSFEGLKDMERFSLFWCLVFTAMIVTVQFAVGTLQCLGIDVFGGVSGGNDVWEKFFILTIGGMYLFDIYTNAWNFGAFDTISWMPWTWPSIILPLFMAVIVTFADEMFLRLTERLRIGSRANAISARYTYTEFKAYTKYLEEMEKNAVKDAKDKGAKAKVDYEWMDK